MSNFLKQKRVRGLGAVVDSLYTSLPVLSIFNFASILIVLYNQIRPYLLEHVPWMKVWLFFLIMAAIVTALVALVYKFVIPSVWHFRQNQMFTNESGIAQKVDRICKKLGIEDETKV